MIQNYMIHLSGQSTSWWGSPKTTVHFSFLLFNLATVPRRKRGCGDYISNLLCHNSNGKKGVRRSEKHSPEGKARAKTCSISTVYYSLLYDEHFLIVELVSKERAQVEKFQLNDSFI